MRQALAGMLWGKQHYFFDLDRWLDEHHVHPLREGQGATSATAAWFHMVNDDVISMPDTWEYPWYASWDLAFHTVALAMVDIDEAKAQLQLMLQRAVPAPERPAAGLRVELQRRQPAGARLGHAARLRDRAANSAARATSPG